MAKPPGAGPPVARAPIGGAGYSRDPAHGAARELAPIAGERGTMRAWERFLGGDLDEALAVGTFVASSWQRSLAHGVNPTARHAPLVAEGERLQALRHRNTDLLTASADIFRRMNDVFAGSRCMMLLTDIDGIVLDVVGDRRTIAEGERIHLVTGGQWREDLIGTNGIGTAIASGYPAQVHASEHFCEGIKAWTCAAAPIREPGTSRPLGVVDISGPPSTYQRNNLSLAIAAARQIETALAERASIERIHLLETCLQKISGNDAMLVVDRSGRIVYAHDLVDLGAPRGARLPGIDPTLPDMAWLDRLPEQLGAQGIDPILLDGRRVGALIAIPRRRPAPTRASAAASNVSEADATRCSFDRIIGASAALAATIDRARHLARYRVPVLIQGETGVGKELLARAIHGEVDFRAPFIVFNCGAVARDLIGAELFGHIRGAFTGATSEGRPGRFELAHGGTLCLDEIGELPLEMQPILLRAIEEGVVYRLGDTTPRRVSVRLLAMTNRDLRQEVEARRFRRDLYYRISVTAVTMPPLRDRPEDVAPLVGHFNAMLADRHGVETRRFGPAVMARLAAHAWPGNVRELRNLVESLLLLGTDKEVHEAELPPELADAADGGSPEAGAAPARDGPGGASLADLEAEAMRKALVAANGNLTEAARQLGISRSTLHRRMKAKR